MPSPRIPCRSAVFATGLLLATVAFAGSGQDQLDPQPGVLSLRTGAVVTAELPNLLAAPTQTFAADQHYVLQVDAPLTLDRAAQLAAAGVALGDYLPTNAYVARLAGVSAAALADLGFVTWVGDYRPEWRIDPLIGSLDLETPERIQIAERGSVVVSIYLFAGADYAPVAEVLDTVPGALLTGAEEADQPLLTALLPYDQVNTLASVPSIQYVEEYPELTLRNSTTRWIIQSNTLNALPLWNQGLHGEGQVLGHIDGKVGVNHCSFADPNNPIGPDHRKILAYNTSTGYDLHGTHTAGTAVGEAGLTNDTRGIAYMGKLVYNSIPSFTEAQLYNRLTLHRSQGATVHTNSWGNDGTTAYDGMCRAIDSFSWSFDDQLVCFAVTNLSALKNPENAKNVLAVGASRDTPNQSQHCSGGTGPTADGRRKPELYAPGCGTNSSSGSSGCMTSALTGTSMACPAIAGAALLARQYFTDGFYPTGAADPAQGFTPSGALLKAVLINGAVDMTSISGYPSNQEGWGRLLLDNSLYFAGDARRLLVQDVRNNTDAALTTSDARTFRFQVTSIGEPLRVTLAWHDAPAAVNASFPPVNNLDLIVTAPNGTVYNGNNIVNGVSQPDGTTDIKNNVEQVMLTSPMVGDWTITVFAIGVPSPKQGYALALTGSLGCTLVTQQPEPWTLCTGDIVELAVAATSAEDVYYQWRRDGEDIYGATEPTFVLGPATLEDAGAYDCVLLTGCGLVSSAPAPVAVRAGPVIDLQPAPQNRQAGEAAIFNVGASGEEPLSYQWWHGVTPLTDGGNISGANTDTLTIDPVGPADVGDYSVVVSNFCGSRASDVVSLLLFAAGDMNCDGAVSFADINPFVQALSDPAGYALAHPACSILNGDMNGDGVLNFADINPFVNLLASGRSGGTVGALE